MSTVTLPLEADQTRLTPYTRLGLSAVLVSLSLSMVSCQEPAQRAPHPDYPPQADACDFFDKTAEMNEAWLGFLYKPGKRVQLRFPREYLRFEHNGASGDAMLLRLRITDFAPDDGVPTPRELPRAAATLLLKPAGDLNVSTLIVMGFSLSEAEDIDLEPFIVNLKPDDNELLQIPPESAGRPISASLRKKDVFVRVKDGIVSDRISCNEIGSVPFPGCRHDLQTEHMRLSLSYRRTFLPDWRQISQRARRFADCAYIQSRTFE